MSTNDGAGYLKVYRTPLGQRMSAYMSRKMSRWLSYVLHHGLCFVAHRALSGCCEEVRVSCEDRINLYPAAPIRLAIMDHRTAVGRG